MCPWTQKWDPPSVVDNAPFGMHSVTHNVVSHSHTHSPGNQFDARDVACFSVAQWPVLTVITLGFQDLNESDCRMLGIYNFHGRKLSFESVNRGSAMLSCTAFIIEIQTHWKPDATVMLVTCFLACHSCCGACSAS